MADFETWLPPIDESIKLELPHFPTAFQTVIFRLWENVSAEKLAEVLHSDVQSVTKEAANHYYFSKGSLAEKVINCDYLLNSGVLFG